MMTPFPEPQQACVETDDKFKAEYDALSSEYATICTQYNLNPTMGNRASLQAAIRDAQAEGRIDKTTADKLDKRVERWGSKNTNLFSRVNRRVHRG